MHGERQLELFPKEHLLQPVLDWFLAESNTDKLQRLVVEIKSTSPRKGPLTSSSVRNPDGSVYISPRRLMKKPVVAVTRSEKERVRAFGAGQ